MQIFIDSPEDMQWLRETHLRDIPEAQNAVSALLLGNEDCPVLISLFFDVNPRLNDERKTFIRNEDGKYTRAPEEITASTR